MFSWIAQGFTNVVGSITSVLDYINPISEKFILKTIIDYLNPFSDNFILKNVLSFLSSIIGYINPFSENFLLKGVLDFLSNMLSYINPFSDNFLGKKIVELMQSILEYLFVPDTTEINIKLESIKSKFAFIDDIKFTISELSNIIQNTETNKSLTITIPNNRTGITKLTIIDLQWYEQYKSYGDVVISCIIYVFFLWRIYINLPNIINGVSSIQGDIANTTINTINKGKGG